MAMRKKVHLGRFRFRDALISAPSDFGVLKVGLRVADAVLDGIYGSVKCEAVVLGDDTIVSLCAALQLAHDGHEVLIAPDALDVASWPSETYSANSCAIYNQWHPEVGELLGTVLPDVKPGAGISQVLTSLFLACNATKRVSLLKGSFLQSSGGHVRGIRDGEILFPVHPDKRDKAPINPLWTMAQRLMNTVEFNHRELEFVETRKVVLTSHPPKYMAAEGKHFITLGQARSEKPELADAAGRLNDIHTAFNLRID